jgi:hypothetical protein
VPFPKSPLGRGDRAKRHGCARFGGCLRRFAL